MGYRLLTSFSPSPVDRKLSTRMLTSFEAISMLAGRSRKGPGSGKSGSGEAQQTNSINRRILIIEDDPLHRELYVTLLEALGHTVIVATDGEAGLALAHSEQPDVIICDVLLPKVGGVEVVRKLKADPFLREIPVIAVTCLDAAGDDNRLQTAGFDGYIPKPIEPRTFTRQIFRFLPTMH
jgi:two-component system, cell cycle response regulator DivK